MLCGDPAVEVVTPVHDAAPEPEAVRSDAEMPTAQGRHGGASLAAASVRVRSCVLDPVFGVRVWSMITPIVDADRAGRRPRAGSDPTPPIMFSNLQNFSSSPP